MAKPKLGKHSFTPDEPPRDKPDFSRYMLPDETKPSQKGSSPLASLMERLTRAYAKPKDRFSGGANLQQGNFHKIQDTQHSIIDSDDYELGAIIASGKWGVIYEAFKTGTKEAVRLHPEEHAIKIIEPTPEALEAMKAIDRNLTIDDIIEKEGSVTLKPGFSHIVPREIKRDNKGRKFIVMLRYRKFLEDDINRLTNEQITKYAHDIATGLAQLHHHGIVHSDLKPANIAIDERSTLTADGCGRALINDFGIATIDGESHSGKRDNMGCRYTRAPECFTGQAANKRSDVWAYGSLLYRMMTGSYILQDELKNSANPAELVKMIDPETYKKLIQRKLKKIPFAFGAYRELIEKALELDPKDRFADATVLLHYLETVERTRQSPAALRKPSLFQKILYAAFAAAMIGTGASIVKYSGKMKDAIQLKNSPTMMVETYLSNLPLIVSTPEIEKQMKTHGLEKLKTTPMIRKFAEAYFRAFHKLNPGCNSCYPLFNENQLRNFPGDVPDAERLAEMLDNAFAKGKSTVSVLGKNGVYHKAVVPGLLDLEDICAIARLGSERVEAAKQNAGSPFFYKYARRDIFGRENHVISQDEEEFLKYWIAYLLPTIPDSLKSLGP